MKKVDKEILQYFQALQGMPTDFDSVMAHVAEASLVLIGESTHGTQEFYRARIELSKRLIMEKGFQTIAIEGDFPDVYRINRYINWQGTDTSSKGALGDFDRFPTWMWRNEEMVSFIDWLRKHNQSLPINERIAMYGLDFYSIYKSIDLIITLLEKKDPKFAAEAKKRYACLDVYQDPQQYGYMATLLNNTLCQEDVLKQYREIVKKDLDFFKGDQLSAAEEKFYLEQNALLVKDAEHYYKSLFYADSSMSWNIRDRHMMQVITSIEKHNKMLGKSHKMIIWAHNSHVGDARATEMAARGELNVGQLAKELYGAQAINIGFTTYTGTVSAASAWEGEVERKRVRPALDISLEAFFHSIRLEAFIIIPSKYPALYLLLDDHDYLERAIGVIYLPQTERRSHYFYAQIAKQFDVIIHYDTTHALIPLERSTRWQKGEEEEDAPETFPYGI
jgi:erythromycin esterase-like protein